MAVSGRLHALATLLSEKDICIHWIGGWLDHREGLNVVERRESYTCLDSNPGRIADSSVGTENVYRLEGRG
jgi:hypothetical protein